jgi:hypothetical protein
MRKRVIREEPQHEAAWLDLDAIAQVEVTSEDPAHPIERALERGGDGSGWTAGTPGAQRIRLLFDQPARLRSIELRFDEHHGPRTQEFVLRWSPDHGRSYREIVRQQYTFSPPGTTCEVERYEVDLHDVTVLELQVVPDIGNESAVASLSRLRLG